ncbi:hypothetical protein [Conexibacter woesei]|uniref:hypothetical protein n=1 Tax=Conexibacter woesei TaxID=191495 RepID=UPI00040F72C1|nr:hypothetical protein [Conexibacter woesei]
MSKAPKYVVDFLDREAFYSVERLPQPHRDIAWDLLDHLQSTPRFGKPLENHPILGDLSDARTLYVIDFDQKQVDWPPPYRIVYRLLPSDAAPQRVQVIWAGPRDDGLVYEVAARRLKRL